MAETINTVDALQGLMRLERKFNEKAEGHAAIAAAAHLAADKIREQGAIGDVSVRDTLQTLMRIERDFNQKAEGCQNLAGAALLAADKIRELDEENRALKKAAKGMENS